LDAYKPGVVAQLDNLHTFAFGVLADKGEPGLLEALNCSRVDLIPVSVSF
jgi:hypothetical protein